MAYRALELYIEIGLGDRNLARVAAAIKIHERTIKTWSSRYLWVARADAHDQEMERIRQAEREKLAREQERIWAARRAEIREREYATGMRLLEQATQMADSPLYEVTEEVSETDDEGRPTVIIRRITPAQWRRTDIARHIDTGSKVLRRAAEMESDRQVLEHRFTDEQVDRAIDLMSPEDRQLYLESGDDKILSHYLARVAAPARTRAGKGD